MRPHSSLLYVVIGINLSSWEVACNTIYKAMYSNKIGDKLLINITNTYNLCYYTYYLCVIITLYIRGNNTCMTHMESLEVMGGIWDTYSRRRI